MAVAPNAMADVRQQEVPGERSVARTPARPIGSQREGVDMGD